MADEKNRIGRFLPLIALLASITILTAAYGPVLSAILDPALQFRYGDFTTIFGEGSGRIRAETTFYTYTAGHVNTYEIRLFTLAMLSALSEWFPFSDSQFHAALILFSMLLGCAGIYLLAGRFEPRPHHKAALIIFLAIFYFLNFWAVDRLSHTWIWFTYAVFPLFLFLGLEHISGGKMTHLVLYSLVFGFFGFLPHSAMYLMMIHGILAAYSLSAGKGWKHSAVFFIVPIAIFIGINLPAIAMYPYLNSGYPVSVEDIPPEALSKNGGLNDLFATANQWWPREMAEPELADPLFRLSATFIFIGVFLLLLRSADRMGDGRRLALMAAAAMLLFMFMAQGTNNQILDKMIDWMEKNGLIGLTAPFREWARISLMIPVFAALMACACIPSLRGLEAKMFLGAFLILLALNVFASPGWDYISLYAAKAQHPDNDAVADLAGGGGKVIFLEGEKTVQNMFRLPSYPPKNGIGMKTESEELTGRLLDAYDIGVVVKDNRTQGLGSWAYEWLDCVPLATVEVCANTGRKHIGAYSGALASSNQSRYADAVLFISGGRLATASENHSSGYLIGQVPSGRTDVRQMMLIEGERDLRGDTGRVGQRTRDLGFSSGGALRLPQGAYAVTKISPARPGSFRGYFIGSGTVRIADESNRTIHEGGPGAFGPFSLTRGDTLVSVSALGDATVDAIWIYEGDGMIGQAFGAGPAPTVVSEETVDPTRWRAVVEADAPFLLSLAEPYSRQFEARVGGERVRPIEILGGINGFQINRTGRVEVEIVYTPQEAYSAAFISTWATLAACLGCLAVWRGRA